jgi:hypothetical protein
LKTAIQQAAEMYSAEGLKLSDDLEYYLKFGYVFCTPDKLLLAREISSHDDGASYVPYGQGDTWFVKMAVGKDCIKWFIEQTPSSRKWVAWARGFKSKDAKIKYYDFDKLYLRLTGKTI